jgi:hypothetical protein
MAAANQTQTRDPGNRNRLLSGRRDRLDRGCWERLGRRGWARYGGKRLDWATGTGWAPAAGSGWAGAAGTGTAGVGSGTWTGGSALAGAWPNETSVADSARQPTRAITAQERMVFMGIPLYFASRQVPWWKGATVIVWRHYGQIRRFTSATQRLDFGRKANAPRGPDSDPRGVTTIGPQQWIRRRSAASPGFSGDGRRRGR